MRPAPKRGPEYLELASGRGVRIDEIHQSHTYAFLFEGLPGRVMNSRVIERALKESSEEWAQRHPAVVIPPVVRPLRPDDQNKWERENIGVLERLPRIQCRASLHSSQPTVHSPGRDGSLLAIVWYQDEYAFPIDPGVRELICALDWDALAFDFDS
jgi:hypothetical protein